MKSSNPLRPHWVFCALATGVTLSFFSMATAGTVAHWRFDEGPADAVVEHPQVDVVLDSSGNGNHMRTWADNSTPTYTSEVPFDRAPQTESPNDFALRFDGRQDVYTEDKPINTHAFDAITLEASFMTDNAGAAQAILGKDGYPNPEEHGAQPVALKIIEGKIELLMTDGAGNMVYIQSEESLESDTWYHVAATATSTEISLWLKRPGDSEYRLEATAEIEGLFVIEDGIWTVGRGMWRGEITNFFQGVVDEIRISDIALEPDQFLGVPPDPEIGRGTLLELSRVEGPSNAADSAFLEGAAPPAPDGGFSLENGYHIGFAARAPAFVPRDDRIAYNSCGDRIYSGRIGAPDFARSST